MNLSDGLIGKALFAHKSIQYVWRSLATSEGIVFIFAASVDNNVGILGLFTMC